MACKVTVYSPLTGEEIESQTWRDINNETGDSSLADTLFAKTRSEQFLAWFGDVYNQGESHSQVVTENGEPLLVYHSSPIDFDSFDNQKSKELGFHFGTLSASLDRFSPSKMVLFEDGEQSEGQIIDISKDIRRTGLLEDGYTVKPYFLNIRNMIEGVDNLDYNPDGFSQEDFYLKSYLDEVTFTNDFKVLVLTFYQKGKITIDQVDQILYTGMLSDGNNGPEALRRALGNPDGYWYKNKKEDEGSISYVVFDPKNIKSIYNNGDFSENENTLFNLNSDTSVDFTLKVINALQKTPRKTYPSGSIQGFYNDLTKQGAPKNQIELLKNYILRNNIQEIDVQDLITGLATEISYSIEINIAKKRYRYNEFEPEYRADGSTVNNGDPSQTYSYLTVPGGTNYRENEIATPAIVPSIKGHAQFSTPSGIGWFRSDESQKYQNTDIQSIIDNLEKSGQLEINCK